MPTQMALPAAKHLNRGLFSDYYLDHIVPTLSEYQSDNLHAQARAVRDELRALLDVLHPENLDEAQLEDRWIKPVLARLGHHWSVQVKLRYRDRGHRKPDYVFTATADDANAFTNQIYEPAQIAHALALGDAKRWGTTLDLTTGREGNPSQQIDEYLRYSELPWGILTDGRFWRLYGRDSSKDNRYYAVDLPTLLQSGSADDFLYFYLFFRREAFSKDADGWLNRVLTGSVDYAESLSERLEQEIYDALELIAQGFLRFRRNRLTPDAPTLKTIYEQSLVLLYRLLFVFYAESRDIFLLDSEEHYGGVSSLTHIKKMAAERLDFRSSDLEREVDFSRFYGMLNDLFFIVDAGSPDLGVPPYNGRLFSTETHPFLAEKTVGDAYLVPALDKLARVDSGVKRDGRLRRVFVDYRDLDVRHLGAIYEKLLEYQLDIATEPLTLKDGKYAPASAGDKIIKQPGEVYLRTGSNERKITGSYYTPDYIVRFIVERTLEPLLNDITRQHAALDADGHWLVRDPEALRRAILAINVLDPATGSGHFMVEAVAYMAEWLRRLGLPAEVEDEDELVYWKRQVVSACIYGVDVNPLAVELARLSLWLTTIARGRPLSFLDHHVRLGNTLVGARITDVTPTLPNHRANNGDQPTLPGEFAFTRTVSDAVGRMGVIETIIAAQVADVKRQEQDYASLDAELDRWRKLAHVWTARHFGLNLTPEQWRAVYDYLVNGSAEAQAAAAPIIEQANRLHSDYHFFHWDLAFPEVFFGADGQPRPDAGFDAVIGNPPYVRQERIQPYKPYLEAHYAVYSGTADLFLYFYERALNLVKPSRRVGFITSGTYMNSNSAVAFRRYLHRSAAFETVVNFGENQPFKGAEMVYPTIAILQKDRPAPTFRSLFVEDVYRHSELSQSLTLPMVDTAADVTALDEWRFQSVELTRLFQKITQGQQTLSEATDDKIYFGIKTGFNEAFFIDSKTLNQLITKQPNSADILKPLLRGQNLRPWYHHMADEHVIFTYHGIDIASYPAIKDYLEQFHPLLEPKPDNWIGDWKGRKPGAYRWYEIQDNVAYHNEFEKPKIVTPDIAKIPRFSWDETGSYIDATGTVIIPKGQATLALLNSRVLWFAFSQIAIPLRLRAGLWQYRGKLQFLRRLPIPELTAAQEAALGELAEAITDLARTRYALHEAIRGRIRDDLGAGGKLNNALDEWWALDFPTLRAEVKKAFKNDIPLRERGDWESFLADQQARHHALTAQIVEREIHLNAVVYDAFNLAPDEIALIERSTKYPYGAV